MNDSSKCVVLSLIPIVKTSLFHFYLFTTVVSGNYESERAQPRQLVLYLLVVL